MLIEQERSELEPRGTCQRLLAWTQSRDPGAEQVQVEPFEAGLLLSPNSKPSLLDRDVCLLMEASHGIDSMGLTSIYVNSV